MRNNNGFGDTKAINHQLDDINVYPVTGDQLDQLSKGSNSDLYLEFSLCLMSVFASFLCSLLVLDFEKTPKAFNFYTLVCLVTFIGTIVFGLLWHRNRKNNDSVINKIKAQKEIPNEENLART